MTRSALRELEDLPSNSDRSRILDRIRKLGDDPRPRASIKLAGRDDRMRIRQGAYRILYSVDDAERVVTVVRIAHRRDAYRSE